MNKSEKAALLLFVLFCAMFVPVAQRGDKLGMIIIFAVLLLSGAAFIYLGDE